MLSRSTPLKRKKPMKSGGSLARGDSSFATSYRSAQGERRSIAPISIPDPSRFRLPQKIDQACAPVVKREYIRSEKLREAYRLIPCQGCHAEDGTVVCAHSNWSVHGKGERIKADDNRAASLCFRCHAKLDQGSTMTEAERKEFWWSAHVKSINLLLEQGLWPDGVPVPDLSQGFC